MIDNAQSIENVILLCSTKRCRFFINMIITWKTIALQSIA